MRKQLINCGFCLGLAACSGADGVGALSVALEAEETITEGIESGDGDENIHDGWQVNYDQYVATVGNVNLTFATNTGRRQQDAAVFVVDLTTVSQASLPLWQLEDLRVGRWNFSYATPSASKGVIRHRSVSQLDFDALRDAHATYLIRGRLNKEAGVSCPPTRLATPGTKASSEANRAGTACYPATTIAFEFIADAATTFGPCEQDGIPGVSIAEGSTQSATITLHGDHLFFNGFPEGNEGGISRLAQWLADCDLDLDGQVTSEELERIAPSDLSEFDSRFQVGGAPLELGNMLDYVRAQLKTQGHMNGEGECPLDGQTFSL